MTCRCSTSVHDFLFTERERLPQAVRDSQTDEQVLVLDEGGAAAVGLFLDPQLLGAADPRQSARGAARAVTSRTTGRRSRASAISSIWPGTRATTARVSLLELELQAEIDKYVSSWWLLREQDPARYPAELHRLLFERSRIDAAPGRRAQRTLS